jgi:SAM-dependent methyltransferase
VENLAFPDESFDVVVVHSGLHHLRCPQKGLTEMYRVSSRGILGFEPNRSPFTMLGARLGFGQRYETAAVFDNDGRFGGVGNTAVPNFVYRFSRRDIVNTIQAYAPVAEHRYRFWYTTRLPERLGRLKQKRLRALMAPAGRLLVFLGNRVPFFANNMAFFVTRPAIPGDLFPWLAMNGKDIVANMGYLERMYRRKPAKRASERQSREAPKGA